MPGKAEASAPVSFGGEAVISGQPRRAMLGVLGVVSHVSRDGWERLLCPSKSLHPQLL